MIEDFLSDLNKPLKAIDMLLEILDYYVEENLEILEPKNEYDKINGTVAIIFAIQLLLNCVNDLREEYYDKMVQTCYNRN